VVPVAFHQVEELDEHSSLVRKTYTRGVAPLIGIRVFVFKYHGIVGISLESLFILPGTFMLPCLKPIKEPNQEFGM